MEFDYNVNLVFGCHFYWKKFQDGRQITRKLHNLCLWLAPQHQNRWRHAALYVCTGTLLPMRVTFGVLKQTERLHLHAKLHLNVFILSASGGQQPQFWGRLGRLILSHSGGEKLKFLLFFGLRHLVMSTVGGNLRKLNTGAQPQTFPYPTASKSFLFSNVFIVKSGAQTLTFKSVMDRQSVTSKAWQKKRDKQTKKTQHFSPPRWRMKSDRHQTWHGDRGPRARSFTSKTFGGLTHSFAARGHWQFGGNQTPSN